MSKQIKYTLMALAAVCFMSLLCNIWQASSSASPESVPTDSTELKTQSELVKNQAAEISSLKHAVDSLKKELNKKKY